MYKSYDFQTEASNHICKSLEKHLDKQDQDNFLICIPTGGGKTFISGDGLRKFLEKNPKQKFLFMAPLQCLISQTYQTFTKIGINTSVFHNTIKTDVDGKPFKMGLSGQVIITMPETFYNDISSEDTTVSKSFYPLGIIMDEAHSMTSDLNQQIRNKYPKSLVIGLTATPFRTLNKDGEHLKDWYTDLYQYTTISHLIDLGRLVTPKYYEYDESNSVIDSWMSIIEKEPDDMISTVVFTSTTEHSLKLRDVFLENGITAEIITSGSTSVPGTVVKCQSHSERNEIYKRFRDRETTVLISVYALGEGWDEPSANIVIIDKKVGNKALYQQMIGRVIRADGIKTYAIVMDFGDNYERFGPVEDIEWELDDKKITKIKTGDTISSKEARNSRVYMKCGCNHVYNASKFDYCPCCSAKTEYKIIDNIGSIIEGIFDDKQDIGSIKKLIISINGAKNYPNIEFRKAINKRYNKEIFDDNGNLTNEFEWVNSVIDVNKIKKSTKLILN